MELDEELFTAAEAGDLEAVQAAIRAGAKINAKNLFGVTSLHLAACKGHVEVVKLLVTKGAKIDATDWCRATPLDLAVASGHAKVAELLIEKGGEAKRRPPITASDAGNESS